MAEARPGRRRGGGGRLGPPHRYNHVRLDAGGLRADAEPILAEARALGGRAKPEYRELALATLPPNRRIACSGFRDRWW